MIVTIWQWLRYLSIRQVIPIRTVDNLVSECVEMRWPEFLANTKLLPIQNSDSQVLLSHYPSNGCIDPCWWVACGVVGPKGHISNFWLLNTFVHSRDCLHLFIFGSGCHIINVAHSESIAGVHITYDVLSTIKNRYSATKALPSTFLCNSFLYSNQPLQIYSYLAGILILELGLVSKVVWAMLSKQSKGKKAASSCREEFPKGLVAVEWLLRTADFYWNSHEFYCWLDSGCLWYSGISQGTTPICNKGSAKENINDGLDRLAVEFTWHQLFGQ